MIFSFVEIVATRINVIIRLLPVPLLKGADVRLWLLGVLREGIQFCSCAVNASAQLVLQPNRGSSFGPISVVVDNRPVRQGFHPERNVYNPAMSIEQSGND